MWTTEQRRPEPAMRVLRREPLRLVPPPVPPRGQERAQAQVQQALQREPVGATMPPAGVQVWEV